MLCFDTETLGCYKETDLITVIFLWDPVAHISNILRFVELNEYNVVVYRDNYRETLKEHVKYLDDAEFLCAFNGTSFDILFIQTAFGIDNATVQAWVLKSFDVLETCRRAFSRKFHLNLLLALNNVGDGTTGSKMEAVHQSCRGDWDALEKYCLDDS